LGRLHDARCEQQSGNRERGLQERRDQHNDQAEADIRLARKGEHLEQQRDETDDGQTCHDAVVDLLLRQHAQGRHQRRSEQERNTHNAVRCEEIVGGTYRDGFTAELCGGTTDVRREPREETDDAQRDDADVQEERQAFAFAGRGRGAVARRRWAIARRAGSLRRAAVTARAGRVGHEIAPYPGHAAAAVRHRVLTARRTVHRLYPYVPVATCQHSPRPTAGKPCQTRWHAGHMGPVLHFAGSFWWLIFPLGGVIGGGVRAIAAANERRANRRLERYRIKQQTKIAIAEASGRTRSNAAANRREMTRVLEEHSRTDAKWLDYELDIAKLLDFPMMTDVRNALTIEFHKAKRRADLLRPEAVDDLMGDRDAQGQYRDAVAEYVSAFDIAETEAIRRRRSDFSSEDQQRIARAQSLMRLATDSGATAQERQSAYSRARKELDGLVALPAMTRASIERKIAGEIQA